MYQVVIDTNVLVAALLVRGASHRLLRIVAAALTEQLAGWTRVEQMAARGNRERFLAALDKVPAAEPDPEDRF